MHAELDSLKQLYKGISLIGELTAKTEAKIVCFGELLSSFIVGEAMVSAGLNVERKDSRQLIIANQNYTNATVDFKITNKNIQDYLNSNESDVILVPGFVASNNQKKLQYLVGAVQIIQLLL